MKKDIHPQHRKVCFKELSTGFTLITGSTVESDQTIEVDGETYPLVYVEISSASHPFYTGEKKLMKAGALDRWAAREKKAEESKK